VFKRKANEVFSELIEAIEMEKDDFELKLNGAGKPKRGSFEIFVSKVGDDDDGEENKIKIWSGLDKGPPRKLKFPDVEKDLAEKVLKIIKK
jgi:hypothetical protein